MNNRCFSNIYCIKNSPIDGAIKHIIFYSAFAAKSPQYTVFAETEYLTRE